MFSAHILVLVGHTGSFGSPVPCKLWTKFTDRNVNGLNQVNDPSVSDEESCKTYCLAQSNCQSCDFDSNDRSCWMGISATSTKTTLKGCNHWDLNRSCTSGNSVPPTTGSTPGSYSKSLKQK